MIKTILSMTALPGMTVFAVILTVQGIPAPHFSSFILPLVVILGLIILNGLFVTAEFAIINVSLADLENLAQEGHARAQQVLDTIHTPKKLNHYVITTQVGITAASLGLGIYSCSQVIALVEPFLTRLNGGPPQNSMVAILASFITVSLLSYLHIVLGEIVPKSVAIVSANTVILALIYPMKALVFIFYLPVQFINQIARGLLSIVGVPEIEAKTLLHSMEELELIVSESAEEGLLNEDERQMLHNIFNFGDRQVEQIMTPRRRVQAIEQDTPVSDLLNLVTESPHSRFPVYQETLDNVIGILHIKDLVRQQLQAQDQFHLPALCHAAPFVPENYSVDKLLKAFKQNRIHMAIVVDEFGGTAGIVTLEDLVEEVVGEVRDEFDAELDPFIQLGPGSVEVNGGYLLDDLVDDLKANIDLGDESTLPDVETIGGLITAQLGRPPERGDICTYTPGLRFTVLSVDGLAVARARIDFSPTETEEKTETVSHPNHLEDNIIESRP